MGSLTIKEWLGTKTPDLKVDWRASVVGEQNFGTRRSVKLQITRKSDQHSGRFRMMAQLNKSNGTLSWGFLEMTHISEHRSIDNHSILMRTMIVFSEVGVQNFEYGADNEETITFIANKKSEFSFPIGMAGP